MQDRPNLPPFSSIPCKQTVLHGIRARAGFYSGIWRGMRVCGQTEALWEDLQGSAGDVRILNQLGLQNPIPSNHNRHFAIK